LEAQIGKLDFFSNTKSKGARKKKKFKQKKRIVIFCFKFFEEKTLDPF
jgi:hypothetical protein